MLRRPVSSVDAVHRGRESDVAVVAIESVGLRVVERRLGCESGCVARILTAEFGPVSGGLDVSPGVFCAWMLRLIHDSIRLPQCLLRCSCVCRYLLKGMWYSCGQASEAWTAHELHHELYLHWDDPC